MFLTVIALLIVIVFLLAWMFRTPKHIRQCMAQIPGPKVHPIIGTKVARNAREVIELMKSRAEEFRSTGITRLWLGPVPICNIFKAEFVEVLLRSTKQLQKGREYSLLNSWLGTGLLTSSGEKWKQRRKMLTPAFHFNILQDFVPVFNKQALVLVDKLKTNCDKGQPFDVYKDITHCALDIICETAMGKCVNAQSKESEYVKAVYKMSLYVSTRMRSILYRSDFLNNTIGYGREMAKTLKILHAFTNSVIADRLKDFDKRKIELIQRQLGNSTSGDVKPKPLAFLDLLFYMSDNLTKLSMEDIREEVDTFMFEGHDTTASAISWATHLIGADPKIQAKVHAELDEVFGDDDRDATFEDLKNLKYLECCIKETLRLFPSVLAFFRKTVEDLQLGPYTVPKGITLMVTTFTLHRDPEVFPDPEVFDPDRFTLENSRGRHPYAYIPFSAGSRNCIGQKFALLELKAVLSHIFRNFTVKSLQTRSELRPLSNLVLRPENGIHIKLTRRSPKK